MDFFKYLLWIGSLGLAALSGAQARAFTLLYTNAHGWSPTTVTLDYDLSNCPPSMSTATILGVIQAAASTWNGIPSATVTLTLGTAVSMSPSAANTQTSAGNPVVVCDNSTFQSVTGADPNYVPAAAKVNSYDSNGHPLFGEIFLNAQSGASIDKVYASNPTLLNVVLAHEMGHLLGLGHSADKNALMYYDATGRTEVGTAQDDIDGITYLYPRQEAAGARAFGCGSLAAVSGGMSGKKGGSPPMDSNDAAGFSLIAAFCIAFSVGIRRFRIV